MRIEWEGENFSSEDVKAYDAMAAEFFGRIIEATPTCLTLQFDTQEAGEEFLRTFKIHS